MMPADIYPVLSPADAPAQWAESHSDALACDVVFPEVVSLCFRVKDGKKRRFVTAADLAKWGVDVHAVRVAVTERAKVEIDKPLAKVTIEGTDKSYFVAPRDGGWAAAAVLWPEIVSRQLGGKFLLAAPSDDTVLVWKPGDVDLDRMIAVGTKELYAVDDWPVTAVVYQWDGERFTPFVEAVPAPPAPPGVP